MSNDHHPPGTRAEHRPWICYHYGHNWVMQEDNSVLGREIDLAIFRCSVCGERYCASISRFDEQLPKRPERPPADGGN